MHGLEVDGVGPEPARVQFEETCEQVDLNGAFVAIGVDRWWQGEHRADVGAKNSPGDTPKETVALPIDLSRLGP